MSRVEKIYEVYVGAQSRNINYVTVRGEKKEQKIDPINVQQNQMRVS